MKRRHPLPAAVYALVEQTPAAVLLEDSSAGEPAAQSRLFIDPLRTVTASNQAVASLMDK